MEQHRGTAAHRGTTGQRRGVLLGAGLVGALGWALAVLLAQVAEYAERVEEEPAVAVRT